MADHKVELAGPAGIGEFECVKFRTMIPDAEEDGEARLATLDDDRIVPSLKWMRSLRADEWRALARQYYEYGWWRSVVLRRHPSSLRARQVIPPVAVRGVLLGLVLGTRWRPALVVPASYAVAAAGAVRSAHRPLLAAAALVTTHFAWAAGIASEFVESAHRRP